MSWQCMSSVALLQEAAWQPLVRSVRLELQVVVGSEPKSAEKVDLLTIFQSRHARRKVIRRKSGTSAVYSTHVGVSVEHLHKLLAAEKQPGLPVVTWIIPTF